MATSFPRDMACIEMSAPGGPDVLVEKRRPLPRLGHNPGSNGDVLIKVAAAGVNGPDLMQRKGLYPPPPGASDLLGLEVSGTIVEVGPEVSRWSPGDEICALVNGGGYAQYVTASGDHCLPIPEGVSLIDAAGLPETYFTVWSNIFMNNGDQCCGGDAVGSFRGAGLRAHETLLVHGGAGGLGTTAIQLAHALGAKVIATDSPASRCMICRDLGANSVIDYKTDDFVETVRVAGGADVILDIVGGDNIARNIKAAKPDARIVQLAFAQGSKVELNLMPIMLKRLSYTGSTLRSRPDEHKTQIARSLKALVWPLFASGKLKPVTSMKLPLAEAASAHSKMEAAEHTGKILLLA